MKYLWWKYYLKVIFIVIIVWKFYLNFNLVYDYEVCFLLIFFYFVKYYFRIIRLLINYMVLCIYYFLYV